MEINFEDLECGMFVGVQCMGFFGDNNVYDLEICSVNLEEGCFLGINQATGDYQGFYIRQYIDARFYNLY